MRTKVPEQKKMAYYKLTGNFWFQFFEDKALRNLSPAFVKNVIKSDHIFIGVIS